MASFQRHVACDKCGSSDGKGLYADGSAWCFVCETYFPTDGEPQEAIEEPKGKPSFLRGHSPELTKRGIRKETTEHWKYERGEDYEGNPVQIANYFDDRRRLVSQKLRTPDKDFSIIGDGKNMPMYGEWFPKNGKTLTIVEGEIDALSLSQAFDLKWNVWSPPNGAKSAVDAVIRAYDKIDQFETIVLMFDMDTPGQDAAQAVAEVLPPGKVKIAKLPHKDANETLQKEGPAALVNAFWRAETWMPDGIISGELLTKERLKKSCAVGFKLPYPILDKEMLGLRKGELTLLTAGSGIGKSTLARELAYKLHQVDGLTIGNVYLEEGVEKTGQGYVAIHNNVPLGQLRHNPDIITDAQWDDAIANVTSQRMWFYDHFGSLASERLIKKLRYFSKVCGCDFGILDHISIVTSGEESSSEGERKDIDILMTRLRSLVQETGMGIIAVCHLKRANGKKSFNEGGQVSLTDLRGSASLEQLSDNVLALERDQQGSEPTMMQSRILKCRETGFTGEADKLNYNRTTGRVELSSASAFEKATTEDMAF